MTVVGSGSSSPEPYGGGHRSTNLGDILERVLDKGLVIAGDIQVNLLDIELLTIKLRLVVASLETAKAVGIDWWEQDPWLSGKARNLEVENQELRDRIAELETGRGNRAAIEPAREGERVRKRTPAREREPVEDEDGD